MVKVPAWCSGPKSTEAVRECVRAHTVDLDGHRDLSRVSTEDQGGVDVARRGPAVAAVDVPVRLAEDVRRLAALVLRRGVQADVAIGRTVGGELRIGLRLTVALDVIDVRVDAGDGGAVAFTAATAVVAAAAATPAAV